MEARPLPSSLSRFREIPIRRPQHPKVLKWIDREFEVIYVNLDADLDANIIILMEDDDEEEEGETWE
ncbi:MAG: hypothetical protein IJ466_11745 [Clostridia bacterium]|nr:hypothetical protein [Clostridia bacterium]